MRVVERVSLQDWTPPWIRFQHLARYEWARQFVPGCRVIDAACGTGYGARMLSEAGAREVVGFDLDPQTVAAAGDRYAGEGVSFRCADATSLPIEDASIDVYTSFETIEHVSDDEALVAEAARVVRPGGRFLCSTPNRLVTNPGTAMTERPFNPFHLREYTQESLDALLRSHFRTVRWRGQTFFSGHWRSFLTRVAGLHRRVAVRCHQARKLACLPWEQSRWHVPQTFGELDQPECLVAECLR